MPRNRLKHLYHSIPGKKHLFSLMKALGTPSAKLYRHLHFIGEFKVKVPQGKDFLMYHHGHEIENEIFWNGIFEGWERVSLDLWTELSASAEVIFDIGANTGIYSLLSKSVSPKSEIHAFEPVDRVYDRLLQNIRLNNLDVHAVRKAMSNQDGIATIYDKPTDHIYSVTVNKDISLDKENSIAVEIETLRLDTYIDAHDIQGIDLMKIDVETHEVEVLQGFGNYLSRFRPTMIIEILNDEVARGVESIIEGLGYDFYVIDERSGVKKVSNLRKSDYYNFLICTPEVASSLSCLERYKASYDKP